MPKHPADDLPGQSVQDSDSKSTGATCPFDGTLVTCSGARDAKVLIGTCAVCKRQIEADPTLVIQTGKEHTHERNLERERVAQREEQEHAKA